MKPLTVLGLVAAICVCTLLITSVLPTPVRAENYGTILEREMLTVQKDQAAQLKRIADALEKIAARR